MNRTIKNITGHSRIDSVIPGVKGQRAFPNNEIKTMDPFVMLDHIGPQNMGTDFFVDGTNGAHPHRGFETITFMFEGGMNHKDSLGNREVLDSGSVQRMNAGSGIIHGGDFLSDKGTGVFHEVQLWVNMPSIQKMSQPDIHNVSNKDIPVIKQGNSTLRIIAGELMGVKGAIKTAAKTKIVHTVNVNQGDLKIEDLTSSYNAFIYVLKGTFQINGETINEFQTVQLNNDGDSIQLSGQGELLVVAVEPINEPVVMGGPFVMNTQEEIEQAYADFKNGLFGTI